MQMLINYKQNYRDKRPRVVTKIMCHKLYPRKSWSYVDYDTCSIHRKKAKEYNLDNSHNQGIELASMADRVIIGTRILSLRLSGYHTDEFGYENYNN